MSTETALWMILFITATQIAIGAPLAWHLRAEMKRARTNLANYAPLGILTLVLSAVTLGLWWYYATSTDQILLAVIPTVSVVWGWLMRGVMNASKA